MVYARKVFVEDLSEQLQEQAEGLQVLYAVHDASGTRLALVANKKLAFSLARQNYFLPQSVHLMFGALGPKASSVRLRTVRRLMRPYSPFLHL